MRNVFKGYQTSKMAVPKLHQMAINKEFSNHHAPALKRPALRIEKPVTPKIAKRPGKNAGIGGGYKV